MSEPAGERVGLAGILADLDRQAVEARVPGLAVEWGFTWAEPDRSTPRWWPQGITTSADAGRSDPGRGIVVTSSYSHRVDGSDHGSRVTFTDLDSLRYRNVLLVTPGRSGRWEPLRVHAGGLVWSGAQLYVAATRQGLFRCDLDDLTRTPHGPFGYEYVLPVAHRIDAVAGPDLDRMRYSFVSLDAGGEVPHLVAGEYGREGMTTRLVRWALDGSTADVAAVPGVGHMQGAAVVGDTWYLSASRGRWKLGPLHVGTPGSFVRHHQAVPTGPEDLSYHPGQDAFWSLSEYPGRRWVYRVPRGWL